MCQRAFEPRCAPTDGSACGRSVWPDRGERRSVFVKMCRMDDKVNLAQKLELLGKPYVPGIIGYLNDYKLIVVKVHGEFTWHKHDETDDLFLVLRGRMTIQLRDRNVELETGEMFVVPRGVEHCPKADEEAHVLLIEPRDDQYRRCGRCPHGRAARALSRLAVGGNRTGASLIGAPWRRAFLGRAGPRPSPFRARRARGWTKTEPSGWSLTLVRGRMRNTSANILTSGSAGTPGLCDVASSRGSSGPQCVECACESAHAVVELGDAGCGGEAEPDVGSGWLGCVEGPAGADQHPGFARFAG